MLRQAMFTTGDSGRYVTIRVHAGAKPVPKIYDQAYFDKWYRHPDHSVASPAELRRKIAMVVAQAEYYLGRPVPAPAGRSALRAT